MASSTRSVGDDYATERHIYEPHRAGIPPLRRYVKGVWRRREFIRELASSNLRASHFDTALGQMWLVVNPLLLGCVYFVLVDIIGRHSSGPAFFAHLLCGLFLFYFVSGAMTTGARSVVGGGKLILNSAFPRAVLPISSTGTAFLRFLPTMVVYAIIHLAAGLPIGLHLLWAFPILATVVVFSLGASMFFAALQVYFRDTASFLPYFVRIWLYLSPVLWFADQVPNRLRKAEHLNPLFSMLGNWSRVIVEGRQADINLFVISVVWAFATFAVGGLFFLSREREFAVRL